MTSSWKGGTCLGGPGLGQLSADRCRAGQCLLAAEEASGFVFGLL